MTWRKWNYLIPSANTSSSFLIFLLKILVIPRFDIHHRLYPYWQYCYRMATSFAVVAVDGAFEALAWHWPMAPGRRVTNFAMGDMVTQVGGLTLECCWLVVTTGALQQRWYLGRGHQRRDSHWNIQAGKDVDIERNVVMNNIIVANLASLMRVRAFFWLEAGTVELIRECPDTTSMVTWRTWRT